VPQSLRPAHVFRPVTKREPAIPQPAGSVSMERRETYKGHPIEVRSRAGERFAEGAAGSEDELELLIDEKPVPHGRLPDGTYFLGDYAYDWTDDLTELARRFIDHRDRADDARRRGPGQ
jgi:hypothetical protein